MKYTVLSSVTAHSNRAWQTCIQAITINIMKGRLTGGGKQGKGREETSKRGHMRGLLEDSYEVARLINLKRYYK